MNPHKFGEGLKLGEQGYSPLGIQRALQFLMAASDGRGGGDWHIRERGFENIAGRWAGDRLAVVGDYTEPGDFKYEFGAENVYALCLSDQNPEDAAEQFEEYAKESDFYAEENKAIASLLRRGIYFRDISEEVRAAVEAIVGAEEGLVYEGDQGWGRWVPKDGEATETRMMRPDMIVDNF